MNCASPLVDRSIIKYYVAGAVEHQELDDDIHLFLQLPSYRDIIHLHGHDLLYCFKIVINQSP